MPLAEFHQTTLQECMQHQACYLCAWLGEQETLQVEQLQRQPGDPMQQVQLCLPHARAAPVA